VAVDSWSPEKPRLFTPSSLLRVSAQASGRRPPRTLAGDGYETITGFDAGLFHLATVWPFWEAFSLQGHAWLRLCSSSSLALRSDRAFPAKPPLGQTHLVAIDLLCAHRVCRSAQRIFSLRSDRSHPGQQTFPQWPHNPVWRWRWPAVARNPLREPWHPLNS
jgi:hypothetical protein